MNTQQEDTAFQEQGSRRKIINKKMFSPIFDHRNLSSLITITLQKMKVEVIKQKKDSKSQDLQQSSKMKRERK